MKRSFKTVISLILAVSTVFGTIVFSPAASATRSGDWEYTVSNGKATLNCYYGSETNVMIPSVLGGYPVTSIGVNNVLVFSGCTSLTSVTIPDSVTSIGNAAFFDCNSLVSINVDDDNSYYKSIDGVLYDKNVMELICCPGGKKGVDIPDSVTSIRGYAFRGCTGLTRVTIPDSVKTIGNYAFNYCKSLTNVTIPDSVTSIRGYAFFGCTLLTNVTIPDSVINIGEQAFYRCDSLVSINVDVDNSYFKSIDGVLYNKNVTKLICCPGGKTRVDIPDSVTSINGESFAYCYSLTSVTIPDSVTSIGNWAFSGCTSLTSVYYQGSEEDWNSNVSVGSHNEYLLNAQFFFNHHHNYVSTVTEPTCTEQGYTIHTCSGCGESYVDCYSDPLGHDYVAVVTAPTCTEQGFTTHTCSICGDFYVGDYVDALGHDFVGGVCTVCGEPDPNCAAVTVEDVRAKAGDEITVDVSIENAPALSSLAISDITLDSPVLTLLGVEWDVENLVISSWDENTGMGVAALSEPRDINGTIVTLTLKVSDDAEDGDYSLTLSVIGKGANNADVAFVTEPGTVTVWSVIRGDFNGDDIVTDADAVYLLFHTFFPETYPLNQDGDVNGDGVVSDADAVYLLYYTFFPDTYPLN